MTMLLNSQKMVAFAASLGVLTTSAMTVAVTPAQANPSFQCGSDLVTYRVRSLNNGQDGGIRCVKFTEGSPDGSTPRFAWYGEGRWGNASYRHVGHAFRHPVNGTLRIGYASDIYGNGENASANFDGNLKMKVLNQGKRIQVTGAWNEEWIRVGNVDYTPLPTLQTCGSNFAEYQVSDLTGQRQGSGVRCVLQLGPSKQTWFGNGQWNGTHYSHLGTLSGLNGVGASDLCDSSFGSTCGSFGYGSLKLTPSDGGYVVNGDWSEQWDIQE
jgi:hypothetical protein